MGRGREIREAEAKESRAFRSREAADEKKAKGGIALSVVAARWAAERKPIPRTVRRAENIIERFEAVVGKLPVNQITRQHQTAAAPATISDNSLVIEACRDLL